MTLPVLAATMVKTVAQVPAGSIIARSITQTVRSPQAVLLGKSTPKHILGHVQVGRKAVTKVCFESAPKNRSFLSLVAQTAEMSPVSGGPVALHVRGAQPRAEAAIRAMEFNPNVARLRPANREAEVAQWW